MAKAIADPAAGFEQRGASAQDAKDAVDSMRIKVTLGPVEQQGEDKATAQIKGEMTLSARGKSATIPMDQKQKLIVEDGEWRLCSDGGL